MCSICKRLTPAQRRVLRELADVAAEVPPGHVVQPTVINGSGRTQRVLLRHGLVQAHPGRGYTITTRGLGVAVDLAFGW